MLQPVMMSPSADSNAAPTRKLEKRACGVEPDCASGGDKLFDLIRHDSRFLPQERSERMTRQSRLTRSQRRRAVFTPTGTEVIELCRSYPTDSIPSRTEWLLIGQKTSNVTGNLTAVAVGSGLNGSCL